MNRGGGANSADQMTEFLAAENCTEICYWGMQFGGQGQRWYNLPSYGGYHPYYLKCFDAVAATPSNGKRIQTASQFDTLGIDPLLPQMNITDVAACLRIFPLLHYA